MVSSRKDCPFSDLDEDLGVIYCKLYHHKCRPLPRKWKPFSCDRILDTPGEAWTPVRSGHGPRVYLVEGDDD